MYFWSYTDTFILLHIILINTRKFVLLKLNGLVKKNMIHRSVTLHRNAFNARRTVISFSNIIKCSWSLEAEIYPQNMFNFIIFFEKSETVLSISFGNISQLLQKLNLFQAEASP